MYHGKTLFAQLMDFLPWTTFTRLVSRYRGDHRVRTMSCAEQFRCMAFAQLTYRESLRDIEACLLAQTAKLYRMGFRKPVSRATLADANERRDWRLHADFAQRMIAQARKLYGAESLGLELSNTVYALDATTIDLCLSVFPWATFRSTKAAGRSNCSSGGSNSTSASNASSAIPRMPSKPRSGSPSPSTCSSPSSKNVSTSLSPYIPSYRSCPSLLSRKSN